MSRTATYRSSEGLTARGVAGRRVVVKRCWGLGNVLCLLPVLDKMCSNGDEVAVITQGEWVGAMSRLRPNILWYSELDEEAFDLDAGTVDAAPCEHRTDEFGRLLGVEGPFVSLKIDAPAVWTRPWEHLRGSVVFGPEGGHASRCWPAREAGKLWEHVDGNLVLVGMSDSPAVPCNMDTRGQLEVEQLVGLLAVAGVVVTMDSAVLHIAAALSVPTVAVFGGVDPSYRVRADQAVVVVQGEMGCCPCNKDEQCDGAFPCIGAARVADVAAAVELAKTVTERVIRRY
jgi:hypothetical protein